MSRRERNFNERDSRRRSTSRDRVDRKPARPGEATIRDDRRGGATTSTARQQQPERRRKIETGNAGAAEHKEKVKINREKTCPFLLRVFFKEGTSHQLSEFDQGKTPTENEEVQLYSWMDSSLREISEHIQREVESARKRDTELDFSLLYPDFNGNFRRKHLGTVRVGTKGPDDLKCLGQLRFMIGDYLSLAIMEPREVQQQQQQQQQQSTADQAESNRRQIEKNKREADQGRPKRSRSRDREGDKREQQRKEYRNIEDNKRRRNRQ